MATSPIDSTTLPTAPPVRWGDGTPLPGTPFTEVVPAAATQGGVVVLSAVMPPGLRVDPHVHAGEDQITVVLTGTVCCRVGDHEQVVEAGGVVLLPRGIEHELWNEGPGEARTLELYTPGGFEEVLRAGGEATLTAGGAG